MLIIDADEINIIVLDTMPETAEDKTRLLQAGLFCCQNVPRPPQDRS
jgi:hypothetical protein